MGIRKKQYLYEGGQAMTEECYECKHKENIEDLFLFNKKYYCNYCLITALATEGVIGLEQTEKGRVVLY